MSIAQQSDQTIVFTKNPSPLPKVVPTEKQFDQYKNPNVYGIWIDDKKVSNQALNDYKNTDFSQVSVSKLYGVAKEGRSYSHQVNMMTNAYYATYLRDALVQASKSVMLVKRTSSRGVGMYRIN